MVWQAIVGTIFLIVGILCINSVPILSLIAFVMAIVFFAIWVKNKNKNGSKATKPNASPEIKKMTYIINPKTMVFHRESCQYAEKTYDFNKRSCDSRSAIMSVGYKPCKYCKP